MFWLRKPPAFDALLRDTAVLDEQLAKPNIRQSVLAFLVHLELNGIDETPENLIDAAMANGCDRDGAMLLVALAWRLEMGSAR